jgi:hypothetical protein
MSELPPEYIGIEEMIAKREKRLGQESNGSVKIRYQKEIEELKKILATAPKPA